MFFHKKAKSYRACLWFFVVFATIGLLFIIFAAVQAWRVASNLPLLVGEGQGELSTSTHTQTTLLLPMLLGLEKPQTYLLLFQNNTELRPGGGFIGSYAVVRVNKGKPEILKVEGTETLDNAATKANLPAPPAPIKKYLGIDRWFFRDSNWSPDFSESAKQALALYKLEGGLEAQNVTMVLGITPTVIETLMNRVGELTVQGVLFTPNNVTEKLQYEVEYGFAKKGIDFTERKRILEPFMRALTLKISTDFILHPDQYVQLLQALAEQKHIMIYSPDSAATALLSQTSLVGTVASSTGDYLLWVDANLAALKTDHALVRTLSYTLTRDQQKQAWVGSARMYYEHRGTFDWRTSRYRSYVRLYVPLGATLRSVSTQGNRRVTIPLSAVDQGQELGYQWFGTFISIEPKETKQLEFVYTLPDSVGGQINKVYTLFCKTIF
ncbi:MAG: DUF4012 domain-containing protein, partial [Patescibacteria group bacterium]